MTTQIIVQAVILIATLVVCLYSRATMMRAEKTLKAMQALMEPTIVRDPPIESMNLKTYLTKDWSKARPRVGITQRPTQ